MTPCEEALMDALQDFYELWRLDRKDKDAQFEAFMEMMLQCEEYFDGR